MIIIHLAENGWVSRSSIVARHIGLAWMIRRKKMKKRTKPKKKKHTPGKRSISDMFCEYAHDYIALGSNLEETKNYLHFACVAWNLSLYPEHEMKEKTKLVVNEYVRLNPSTINADHLKHDIEKLIEKKLKDHPNISRLITKISIEEKENNYLISTESTEFQLSDNKQ
jgi:hypothetical protein